MSEMRFTVPGQPVAWSRPRTYGGKHFFNKPEDSCNREKIRAYAWPHRPNKPFEGPVSLEMVFHVKKPKRLKKGVTWCSKRPDLDNLVKGVGDSLDGVAFFDDGQIARIDAIKIYGDEPKTEIVIKQLEHKGDQK